MSGAGEEAEKKRSCVHSRSAHRGHDAPTCSCQNRRRTVGIAANVLWRRDKGRPASAPDPAAADALHTSLLAPLRTLVRRCAA